MRILRSTDNEIKMKKQWIGKFDNERKKIFNAKNSIDTLTNVFYF